MHNRIAIRVQIDRILFFLYIIYTELIAVKYYNASWLYYLLLFGYSSTAIIMHAKTAMVIFTRNRLFVWYLLFLASNALISLFVAADSFIAFSYIGKLLEMSLLVFVIFIYAKDDGNLEYTAKVILVVASLMALIILVNPTIGSIGRDGSVYLTIAEGVNAHGVAVTELIGAWACLYLLSKKRIDGKRIAFALFIILVFVYAIYKTNSRKGLIGIALILIFSLSTINRYLKSAMSNKRRLVLICMLIVCIIALFVLAYTTGRLYSNNLFERIASNYANADRALLILDAFSVFLRHPIIGVGFNNYKLYSSFGLYSHCTYAELLACCGIVGGLPFVVMLYKSIVGIFVYKIEDQNDVKGKYIKNIMSALAITILFIGWTQIIFYERYLMYAIGMLGGYLIAERKY